MSDQETFDFWYALKHTQTVLLPQSRLETFGNTVIHYHILSELMDTVGQVRVREGRVTAQRPQILTPSELAKTMLEGFGTDAEEYAAWLREHEQQIAGLLYGFVITKQETSSEVVSGRLDEVAERVSERVRESQDPLGAVILGVEKPWEVCLIKLMVEVSQQSFMHNWQTLKQQAAKEEAERRGALRDQIEVDFRRAAEHPGVIQQLGAKLQKLGLFEEYQERFFELIRKRGR